MPHDFVNHFEVDFLAHGILRAPLLVLDFVVDDVEFLGHLRNGCHAFDLLFEVFDRDVVVREECLHFPFEFLDTRFDLLNVGGCCLILL